MNGQLRLRAVEPKDKQLIYNWENDTSVWKNGTSKRFVSMKAVEDYIKNAQNLDIFADNDARFMIDNGKETVGCVDLYDLDAVNSHAGVGIYIDKKYRGKSYGQNAIMEIIDYAKNLLNLHSLFAYIADDNFISERIFIKNNFSKIGTLLEFVKSNGKYSNINIYQIVF